MANHVRDINGIVIEDRAVFELAPALRLI